VFGGHIIFTCFAQITRALPNLLTLIAWENCDHLAPVLEGDRLRTTFDILDRISVADGGALLRIAAKCHAARGTPETETTVLDWTFWAWSA
ncbi:MAG: acyl dehydratase, partial [Steroidobacteraceae bacterium]